MSEPVSFELRLIDAVSANAKKAADALRGIDKQAKKTQKGLDFGSELERAEHQLKRLSVDPKGYQKLMHAQKELGEQRKRLGKESFFEAFKEKMSFGKMFSAAFLGDLLAEGLIEAIKKPIEMFAEGVKEAFKAGAAQEKLALSYSLMFGEHGGNEKMEDQERFASNTRFSAQQIGTKMLPLYNSGMGDKAARQAFSTASDLEARTGRPIDEFIEMMAKINNKGGITEKMLLSLGYNAKAFYTELGKSTHVTAEEAKKRAEGGKYDPQLLMNQLTKTTNAAQGGAAGTGGKKLSETMGERWTKLTMLPEQYMEKISKSPAWNKLSDKLGDIFKQLDPKGPKGQQIIGSLMSAFDKLSTLVSRALSPENIDKFAAGVTSAVAVIADLPRYLDMVVTASEVLATVWAGSKLVGALTSLTSLLPVVGTVLGAISIPVAAAVAAFASLGVAVYRIVSAVKELGGVKRVVDDFKEWATGGGYGANAAVASDKVNDNSPEWKKNKARGEGRPLLSNVSNYDLSLVSPGMPQSSKGGRGVTQVHAPMNITIHAGSGDDSTHTAQQAAEGIQRHAVTIFERAAAEGGG